MKTLRKLKAVQAMVFFILSFNFALGETPQYFAKKEAINVNGSDISDSAWNSPLMGIGVKSNEAYTEGNFFLTVPVWSTIGTDGTLGGNYLILEPYTSWGEQGEVATSLGLGYRHLFNDEPVSALQKTGRARFMEEGWFVGGNVFVDLLDTQHNNQFWQLGVGAEIGTRYLELRGNYYIPLTGEKLADRQVNKQTFRSSSTSYRQSGGGAGDPFAAGSQILQDINYQTLATTTTRTTTVRTVTELYEKGMEGWDVEGVLLLPYFDQWMDVKLLGGYYSFDNQPFGPQSYGTGNVQGWKAGLEVRPVPAVVLSGTWYEDERLTGGNWNFGVQLQIPLDKNWKDSFTPRRRHLVEHLAEPVHRQNDAIKIGNRDEQKSTSKTSVKRVTRVVAQDSRRLVLADDVVFVNNGGAVGNGIQAGADVSLGGTGTAETPVDTVQAGSDIAVANGTTTSRVWKVYTQGTAIPYSESINVTGSVNFISSGKPLIGEGGKVFGSGVVPQVAGGFSAANIPSLGITSYEIIGGHATTTNAITAADVSRLSLDSLNIRNTTGSGIAVSGAPTATEIANSTINSTGGAGLLFTNTTGSTLVKNVSIDSATGSSVAITGGGVFAFDAATSITNPLSPAFSITGGSSNVTFEGSMTQPNNAALVVVTGGHTGSATFQTGALSATNGSGLLFDNADGSYNFLGTTALNGGDAGVDILNGSGGTFAFGAGTSINNPTGQAFFVNGGTSNVSFAGSIAASTGPAVEVLNHATGAVNFLAGSNLTATGGSGLQFTNDTGTYNFLGTTTLNGGDAGIDILASNGTFNFGTGTTITNPTGTGFLLVGGQANVTYSGSITDNSGFALQVIGHSVGTLNFNTGTVASTAGLGVQFVADSGIYNLANVNVSNSTGAGVEVTASPTGTFTFGSLTASTTAGAGVQLNNAGTVSILDGSINGTGSNGIFSLNTTLTATGLTIGNNLGLSIAGIGIEVINNDGTARLVTLSNNSIRSTGAGILTTDNGVAGGLTLILDGNTIETLAGGSKALSITGSGLNSTIVRSMNGGTVIGNGSGGGVLFNRVTFDSDGATLGNQQVAAGTWNIGQGLSNRVLNDGLHFDAPTGDLGFTTLNIFNNAGTGLFVDAKTLGTTFNLDNTGGVVNTTGGSAMFLDPLTTNLTFTSVTSTGSSTTGITIDTLLPGSSLTIGSTTVTGSAGDGIRVETSNGANINFGNTTVTNAGGDGIDLSLAGGASVTFGNTLITNPGASGINMSGATGTFVFGNVDINGTALGNTAFNLNGGDATVTAATLDINGGGIGIDLRNTLNARLVQITNGGTIQNVGVGVQLGGGTTGNFAQSANALFTYDVTGGNNSTISGTVAIEARGLVSTAVNIQGTYDFRNVTNLSGAQNFEPSAGTPYFVADVALGSGDGSTPLNAAVFTSIAANTGPGDFIVLVNNNGNLINLGAASITLQDNQHVDTFGNGRTFSAGTVPINILLPGVADFTDPFGFGAATLTGSSTLIIAANNNVLQNFTMQLSGAAIALAGTNINGLAATGLTITGTGNVFDLTNSTGTVNLVNNTINTSGGSLLDVDGGTANITLAAGTGSVTNTDGSGVRVVNTTGGSVVITGVNVASANSTPLTFDNNDATFAITGSTFAADAGVTLLNVDATSASTTNLVFNNTNTLTHTSGQIASIGAGARNIDLSAHNFTNTGTTALNVISSVGQTGGTISFGNIGITNFNNAAGTAVNLTGSGGTVNFNALNISTADLGAGLAASGALTLNVLGAANSITTGGGRALSLTNTVIGTVNFNAIQVDDVLSGGTQGAVAFNGTSGGTANFGTVTVERSTVDAVSLQNVVSGTYNFNGLLDVVSVFGASNAIDISGAATGSVFNFANIDLRAIPTADAVSLSNNNGAQVSFTGGQINRVIAGDAIHSVNTNLTATGLSIGNNLSFTVAGNGIEVINNDGVARTVTLSNNNIRTTADGIRTSDSGVVGELSLVLNNNTLETTGVGSLAMSITGSALNSTTVNAFNGVTVTANGTGGGIRFNRVTFDAVTGGAIQQVAGGATQIGQGTLANQRVQGDGLRFDGPTGDLALTTLNIFNNAGTGLFVDAKTLGTTFALGNTGGVTDTTGGAALFLDPLTANLTFSSVTSLNSTTFGITLDEVAGSVALGTVSVTNAATEGLVVTASSAAVTAGTVTVNGAMVGLLFGANAGGSFTATGATSLTGLTHTGINATNGLGTYSFKDLTIGFSGTGRGLDFRNSTVQFEADNTTITGNGNATSIAIDLSGTQNPNGLNSATPNILLGKDALETATISNVGVGVKMGEAGNSAGAYLRFGNQTPLNSGSSISVISGGTTLDTSNLTSSGAFTQGRYEFAGVAFTGNASFQLAPNFYFVAATATGLGDGSTVNDRANAATFLTALGASSLTNKTVVMINDGGVINLGNNTASLNTLTNIDGFGNGNSVSAYSIPANVIIDTFSGNIADPTGNGAATLTANAGNNVVTLTDAHSIRNINITGGNFLMAGTGFNGLTVQGVGLSAAGTGVFSFTSATGVINITNNTINQSGGQLLDVNLGNAAINLTAGTGSIFNSGGSGIRVRNTTAGSVTLTGLNVTGATATPLTFDNNDATFTITNSTFATAAGVKLLDVDATSASTTGLVFNNTNTLTHASGQIASIGAGARNIDLSAHNFTNTGTTALNVISSVGQSGGTISFGNINIASYNNAAGTAVSLLGSAGTVSFADLDIATTAGAGLNVGAITFAPGATATLNASGANALTMNGTTLSGGSAAFASVTSTGGVNGISLLNVTGAATLTSATISNSTGDGINLNNAGSVSILGGSVNGTGGHGIVMVNTAGALDSITLGNSSAIAGNGIQVTMNDATSRVLDMTVLGLSNITGKGIFFTQSGGATQTLTISSTGVASGGNALEVVKSGAGALNFSLANSSMVSTTGSAMRVDGTTGAGVLTVTDLSGNQVTGSATGGMIFETVTFDQTPGGGFQQVAGGDSSIGSVTGDGLRLNNVRGSLGFGVLNISNDSGTGIFIRDAGGKGGTFAFSTTGGSVTTTNGTALDIDPVAFNVTFSSVSSTNAAGSGINLDTISGTTNLGNVSVTNAAGTGLRFINSSAAVTAGTVTINGAATGMLFGINTGGSFTATGATSLTGITGTGINANAATGSYTFAGLTIGYTGAGRGIDLRGSNVTTFTAGNTSITGNGTAGSIAIDLSGSLFPGGQPVSGTPNIRLGTGAGQTATISNVANGVKLGEAGNSAHSFFRYGNQTSGSSIAVTSGFTIDATNLTGTGANQEGRYEFAGVTYTGQASFEGSNTDFIFVGTNRAGSFNGSNPTNRYGIADGDTATVVAFAAQTGKTIVFVNDGAGINFGASTLSLGANTSLLGFGNGATVIVPGGIQPLNVFGTFNIGGGTFNDGTLGVGLTGAATVLSSTSTVTLASTGNTLSNFILGNATTAVTGTNFGTLTVNGMVINTNGGALNLNTGTLAGTGFNSITSTGGTNAISLTGVGGTAALGSGALSGASGVTFNVSGGSAAITYNGTISKSGAASAVVVNAKTSGSIAFGGLVTANTSSATGINLTGNTGSTISFNSGLNIDTTTGTGFIATGGGTINVAATAGDESITSTNARALLMDSVTAGVTFDSLSSSGSATTGVTLLTVAGSVTTGSTTVASSTSQGIFVNLSSATVGFGNTSINGNGAATEGVRLENNSNGTFTFGTLSIVNSGGRGFLHTGNGGLTTVSGATTITNAASDGILIQNAALAKGVTFANVTETGSGGTGVVLGTAGNGNAGNITFAALNIAPDAGQTALASADSTGTITTTSGTITATGAGSAIVINGGAGVTPLNLAFTAVNAAGGTNGISLTNASGTAIFGTGTLTGASGATFNVVGGTVSTTYSGNITQANNAALLNVSGGHATGTLLFQTGTLSATNGTGLQFNNADGTYNFTGTTTLNGGDAGIDILNGSAGTFGFGASTSITNPTGNGFTANGSSANVTYSGNITKSGASAGLLVDVTNESGGTITFQTGTLSSTSTAGTGINLNNADGTVNFNGTTTLNGGNAHVDINTGSSGTISFGTGTTITSPSGTAFVFNGSTAGVTYSGNITQANNALLVDITNQASGTITFQTGTLSATNGGGINLNNVDGTVNFNGTTTLNGGNAGIDVSTGSGGTIAFSAGASITNPTNELITISGGTANFTYSGSFSKTNAGIGILVQNNTGGTINFDGASATETKTLTTSTGNAVNLLTNTGATINFTGNSLVISTTSGIGFNATGGGTVTVQGTGNTITSTAGTALNVANTTIGAGNLVFQSISSSGASSGIVLNTTGSSGGLNVTGTDGADAGTVPDAGTGGTIQASSSHGISLTSTQNFRIGGMNIINNLGSGISGSTINGFLLDGVTISGNGNDAASDESGINVAEVTGSAFGGARPTGITNSTISNNNEFEVQITNTTGTLTDFQLNNNTITANGIGINGNVTSPHGNLVNFLALGTANMTINTSGGTYTGNIDTSGGKTITATALHIDHSGSGGMMTAAVNGGTFLNNNVAVTVSVAQQGSLDFDILNTISTFNRSHALNLFVAASSTGTVTGSFANNSIGTAGVQNSGSEVGVGIRVQNEGSTSTANPVTVLIDNNTIRGMGSTSVGGFAGVNVNLGIAAQAFTRTANITITDNNINDVYGNRAIIVQQNNTTAPGIVNATISGNDIGSNVSGAAGDLTVIRLRQLAGGTFNLTQTSVANLAAVNTIGGNTTTVAEISVGGTVTFGAGLPTLPPLLFAPGGVSATSSNAELTQTSLNTLGAAAISLWATMGLSEQQTAQLQMITFGIADLAPDRLGEADGTQVFLSSTAAGNYWFIDDTPLDNSEFTGSGSTLQAIEGGQAAGRVDAFSVILHEIGHTLGFEDAYGSGVGGPLMEGSLGLDVRLLPIQINP